MRKDLSFLGFWVPTCPSQHGRTLSVGPQSPFPLPPKWIHLPVPTSTSLKFSTSELTNSWPFMYYKMDFISFIDSWNISSPWIRESSFATKWLLFFFSGQVFGATKWRWVFIFQKSKKHLLQNDKPGVCNKMHFTSPFFFYQFRVRWHSVVSISSPFLWWKFKGGLFNCKHRVASTVCANARDVNIAWHRGLSTIPDPIKHFECGHWNKALNIMQQSSCCPVENQVLGFLIMLKIIINLSPVGGSVTWCSSWPPGRLALTLLQTRILGLPFSTNRGLVLPGARLSWRSPGFGLACSDPSNCAANHKTIDATSYSTTPPNCSCTHS